MNVGLPTETWNQRYNTHSHWLHSMDNISYCVEPPARYQRKLEDYSFWLGDRVSPQGRFADPHPSLRLTSLCQPRNSYDALQRRFVGHLECRRDSLRHACWKCVSWLAKLALLFTYFYHLDTPWAEPTQHDEEFMTYVQQYSRGLQYAPWNEFSSSVLGILLAIWVGAIF